MIAAKPKSDRLELYRLAKKAENLANLEKRALLAIADTCSMHDAECRKSVNNIKKEFGLSPRSFHYGVRGRRRGDGTEYFPGLLRRGLVFIRSGGQRTDGVPTAYRLDMAALRTWVYGSETSAQTSAQISTPAEPTSAQVHRTSAHVQTTSAQMSQNLCTCAHKVLEVHQRCAEGTKEERSENPNLSKENIGSRVAPGGAPDSLVEHRAFPAETTKAKDKPSTSEKLDADVALVNRESVAKLGKGNEPAIKALFAKGYQAAEIIQAIRRYVADAPERDQNCLEMIFFYNGTGRATMDTMRDENRKARQAARGSRDKADIDDVIRTVYQIYGHSVGTEWMAAVQPLLKTYGKDEIKSALRHLYNHPSICVALNLSEVEKWPDWFFLHDGCSVVVNHMRPKVESPEVVV